MLQALFSDYIDESGGSEADKAGAVGQLGMAVGFSFMVGPMMASLLISEYRRADRAHARARRACSTHARTHTRDSHS